MVPLQLPERMSAKFEVMTPMFIGDAQKNAESVYPQSFKGALRFWWRALMWSKCREEASSDVEALKLLHQWEGDLFGRLPKDREKGQAIGFTLQVNSPRVAPSSRETNWPKGGNSPSGYLGMGLWESGKKSSGNYQPHREGLPQLNRSYSFDVILTLNPNVTAEQKQQLQEALQCMGWFGGLGSRARRGFGSLQLKSIDDQTYEYATAADYHQAVQNFLQRFQQTAPAPYTAFSQQSTFAHQSGFKDAEKAHEALGVLYKNYRGQPSTLRGAIKKVFGLPLVGVDVDARRASPLIFHIYKTGKTYGYSALHLPASIFHPKHTDADFVLTAGLIKEIEKGARS